MLEIARMLHNIDPCIKSQGINDFHLLLNLNNFNFKRSFEQIESFASSSEPTKFYCGIITNRKLQVYDYIMNKLLFSVKLPNASGFNVGKNLIFLDSDNLLLTQDG